MPTAQRDAAGPWRRAAGEAWRRDGRGGEMGTEKRDSMQVRWSKLRLISSYNFIGTEIDVIFLE